MAGQYPNAYNTSLQVYKFELLVEYKDVSETLRLYEGVSQPKYFYRVPQDLIGMLYGCAAGIVEAIL